MSTDNIHMFLRRNKKNNFLDTPLIWSLLNGYNSKGDHSDLIVFTSLFKRIFKEK